MKNDFQFNQTDQVVAFVNSLKETSNPCKDEAIALFDELHKTLFDS
ncbi:hypothetical protein [Kriegella aquimaris]|nr:hypothetical protein [Kriegella aquimaris]